MAAPVAAACQGYSGVFVCFKRVLKGEGSLQFLYAFKVFFEGQGYLGFKGKFGVRREFGLL